MMNTSEFKYFIKRYSLIMICFVFFIPLQSCKTEKKEKTDMAPPSQVMKELSFTQRKIMDSAKYWWAHTPAEINGDGIIDIVFINNNASGGYLGYYQGKTTEGLWELKIIADEPPTGGLFAGGDLECADIDGDGDNDVIAIKHPGEWTDAGAEAELFWYENPDWKPHRIGTVPNAVKDVSLSDFNNDGKMDLSVLTFEEHTLSIFQQESPEIWNRVQFIKDNESLHEGMDIGDIDGDGDKDIVANGFVYYNPGGNLTEVWKEENIDTIWNNQEGDWSRNGTKTFVKDINKDGKTEVFISHSERTGYPLKMYYREDKIWKSRVISDSIAACHTLKVFDFDGDGDDDILAGINRARAVNLKKDRFEITIFLSENNYKTWKPLVIGSEGIYNGEATDYDNDGDVDIFRYPDHEATDFYILENNLK